MESISYLGLAILSLLLVPTLLINRYFEIKLNLDLLISVVRMFIQLSLVGCYLQYIFDLNNPFLNLGYLMLMGFVASYNVVKSTDLKKYHLYLPVFIAIVVPNILMLLFLNAFVLNLTDVFEARYLITMGGMLLGNLLNGNIIAINSYHQSIKDNLEKINYELALGATRFQATRHYFKNALVLTIKPRIASMATLGLVALPGMMTGQILGGAMPSSAIMYQIAIMISIFISRYFGVILSIFSFQNIIFDQYDQLK